MRNMERTNMKKTLTLLLTLLLCLHCAAIAENNALSPEALQARIDGNPYLNLFDVRDAETYEQGHIPTAVSVPLSSLRAMLQSALDNGYSYMTAEIIVYGEEEDAAQAMGILAELGFTNVRRLDSLESWTGKLVSAEDERRLLGGLDTVDIYGQAVDEGLLRGHRLTMVNVWATYCGPCINEMSDLGRLAKDVAGKGVQIIGLLSDATDAGYSPVPEKVEQAKKIVEETKADYPHLLPSDDLCRKVIWQLSAVPTTFFVDETGMPVGSAYVGARSYDAWADVIDQVLEQTQE